MFKSLGLVKKTDIDGKKTAYAWLAMKGLENKMRELENIESTEKIESKDFDFKVKI